MDKPEGSYWWRTHRKLLNEFKQAAICNIGSGNSILFWHDPWQDLPLSQQYPDLYSFAIKENFPWLSLWTVMIWLFIFTDLWLWKHMINSMKFLRNSNKLVYQLKMINGLTNGKAKDILLWRCINGWWEVRNWESSYYLSVALEMCCQIETQDFLFASVTW